MERTIDIQNFVGYNDNRYTCNTQIIYDMEIEWNLLDVQKGKTTGTGYYN